jgi:arsenate reductase
MKKGFYLSTCSTCKRILKEIELDSSFELQDIKTNKISGEDLDQMKELAGSYESLFSRKAMKYRSMGLNNKDLKEEDYRGLILEEYTFLKRPVFVFDDAIFIGSAKKSVELLKQYLAS